MVKLKNHWFLALPLLVLVLLPLLVDNDKIMTISILTFIVAALASSWNILGGFAGQISLGHAAFFGIGALATRLLWFNGTALWLSFLAGGAAAVLLAVILGLPVLRLKGIYFAIGTLALAEAIRITAGSLLPGISALPVDVLRSYNLVPRYFLAFAVLLLTVGVSYYLTRSKLGLGMLAVREDEDAARSIGVNVVLYKLLAFIISAGLAGLAGGSYAYFHVSYYHYATFSPVWTFDALIVAFVGGIGTLPGPLIGAVFFVLVRDVLAVNLRSVMSINLVGIHLFIFGLLFILIVLLMPGGLLEGWRRLRASSGSIASTTGGD
jgi:branched-chain amino acid transport system permease protein